MRFRAALLAAVFAALLQAAQAQAPQPGFAFAAVAQARAILGARDDYVRATAPLERSAKMRTGEPVDEARYVRYMESAPRAWTEDEQRALDPLLRQLDQFIAGLKWSRPKQILLIKAKEGFTEGLPHTRANAIVLPDGIVASPPAPLPYILAHELFHVLSRNNPELRERLYAAIGFRPCAKVEIPESVAKLRITNPDAPESRHTIAVRHQGRPVEALPYPRLASETVDPSQGFQENARVGWLLVERQGDTCKARPGDAIASQDLQGLYEQVGRNTEYLWHAEEILADNFALLFLRKQPSEQAQLPSPEILRKLEDILFN
jgi:hypothetical protein